jgi:hypothetical protein
LLRTILGGTALGLREFVRQVAKRESFPRVNASGKLAEQLRASFIESLGEGVKLMVPEFSSPPRPHATITMVDDVNERGVEERCDILKPDAVRL